MNNEIYCKLNVLIFKTETIPVVAKDKRSHPSEQSFALVIICSCWHLFYRAAGNANIKYCSFIHSSSRLEMITPTPNGGQCSAMFDTLTMCTRRPNYMVGNNLIISTLFCCRLYTTKKCHVTSHAKVRFDTYFLLPLHCYSFQ